MRSVIPAQNYRAGQDRTLQRKKDIRLLVCIVSNQANLISSIMTYSSAYKRRIRTSIPWQEGWNWMNCKVPSNFDQCMILRTFALSCMESPFNFTYTYLFSLTGKQSYWVICENLAKFWVHKWYCWNFS